MVALYHELQKGVVAETVGWHITKGAPEKGRRRPANPTGYPGAYQSSGEAGAKFKPTMYPTRQPPAAGAKQGGGAAAPAEEAKEGAEEGEAAAPALSPAEQAQCAAEVQAFQPETLPVRLLKLACSAAAQLWLGWAWLAAFMQSR